ncbi:TRAP transporter substrate-binding protein [Massilia sp. MS-15]|uniref:TRAP transporter substrate-binding protein n=1 Tax=Massilia sp. MS-15 TaxID=2878200 RepID=UPI001CD80169|nr:TRAP transporter substrate-binding protein [Massilia sp. MS-15]MCA1248555.1 TRAP transporter substrate-binding protein [Massilia sp. MS-15]
MKRCALPIRLLAVLLLAGAAHGANAQSRAPIVIKFSHVVAPDTPKGRAAERFRQLAEEMTGGRVRVEVYPNSQLYKDREELEALQLGAVQMLAPSLAKFAPLGVREFEAFDLPYIFPSKAALYRVTEGRIGRELLRRLEPKGITGLAYWDNGFKIMSANKPLLAPADFRGLRMRIQASRVLDAQMRTLGAQPLALAFSDTAPALRDGVVQGTENTPSNMYTQGMHAYQRHLTVSNHGYLGYAVIVNKKFWDGLPRGLRRTLERAMQEATAYEKAIAQRTNDEALEKIRQAGSTTIHRLSPQQQAQWRRAMQPVYTQMDARIGRDVVRAIRREAGTD